MPLQKSSSPSRTKRSFSRVMDFFKRRMSVTEMTEARHPSLDNFLAQRGANQNMDDESIVSMCSTCNERMLAQVDKASAAIDGRVDSVVVNSPALGISQVSLTCVSGGEPPSQSSLLVDYTSARRHSNATTSFTTAQVVEDKHASYDTLMASPLALVQAFRDYIPAHPALVDLPPPFNRHSDPTYQEGPAKRAEIIRQASQRALKHRCSDLDDEADKLADRLQETEKELSGCRLQLEDVLSELAAREKVHVDARKRCSELEETAAYRVRRYNILDLAFKDQQAKLAKCSQQEELDRERIQLLLKCGRHRHCRLRYDIMHLSEQLKGAEAKLQDLDGIQYKHDLLQYELRAIHESQEEQQIENEHLEIQLQQYRAQNETLRMRIQSLWDQRSSEEDIEATRLAEQEVYVMHERLKVAERELKQRRTSLDVVRQHNQDLALEIACLKHRLVEKKDTRRTL